MLKVYGSRMCPDCVACKANFDAYQIPYEFLDINDSLRTLKDFLILRDREPVFDHLKKIDDIGIPACITEDGTVFTDWEGYLKEQGWEVKTAETGQACSLDHKGC
ncbi:MAG: glutaredoxin [Solobacterium sp.]|jgi:glutaredoxin-related protein|nr:glutaredoxin [Solobacterium sp.]MCH4205092.1 glutaredoxin [Solobacterium sp.]MCH4226685.1 glutaredoxin [Solobacterium sp.]MCH4281986.1 glutaredoxin [Solobacterium sp.]